MNSFTRTKMSQEEFFNSARQASNILDTDFAKSLAQAGMVGLPGVDEALGGLAEMAGGFTETIQQQMDVQGDNTKTLVGFGETIDTLKSQAESISTDVFGKILKSENLGNLLETISGSVEGLTGSSVTEKLGNALGNGFMFVKEKAGAVKEFFTKGEDGKGILDNLLDNDPNTPGIQPFGKQKKVTADVDSGRGSGLREVNPMFNGSDGFQNFGSGTPATLHGIEAVVPKNDMAQLAKVIEQMTGNTGAIPPAGADMQSVNTENHLRELVELNKNAQRALNTLVTIGSMTEKNTKTTNNELANMGGSLV
jgi:hypothetical protein